MASRCGLGVPNSRRTASRRPMTAAAAAAAGAAAASGMGFWGRSVRERKERDERQEGSGRDSKKMEDQADWEVLQATAWAKE